MADHPDQTGWFNNIQDYTNLLSNNTSNPPAAAQHPDGNNTSNFNQDAVASPCDLGEACDDGTCDPQAIIPCASLEPEPCYNPECSTNCEVDGMDLLCTEQHSAPEYLLDQHYTTPSGQPSSSLQNRPLAYSVPQAHSWPSRFSNLGAQSAIFTHPQAAAPCYHPVEHAGAGCINPLDMHINPSAESILAQQDSLYACCCGAGGVSHLHMRGNWPTLEHHLLPVSDEASYPSPQTNPAAAAITETHSEETSQTVLPPHQHTMSVATEQQCGHHSSSSFPELLICKWMGEQNTICAHASNSAAQLHDHMDKVHLPKRLRKGPNANRVASTCHWAGCDRARSGKLFTNIQHLQNHMLTHTGWRPFVCKHVVAGRVCEQAFTEKRSLQAHQLTHTKKKDCACPHCSRRFKSKSSLKGHIQKEHSVPNGRKKYQCPECEHKDNDRANLARHIDTHYPSRFYCNICGGQFGKRANANRHLNNRSCKMHHSWPIPPEKYGLYIRDRGDRPPINYSSLEIQYPDSETVTVSSDEEAAYRDLDVFMGNEQDSSTDGNEIFDLTLALRLHRSNPN